MAISDDFSVENDGSGDIRYTGDGTTYYTVLEFKNYLGSLQDDEQASGDDLADITTETIYERSTDQILTLNLPFNIDATAVEHLYDGSITQNDGDDIYSGLYVVGVVVAGTEPMIVRNNEILTPYWGTGINSDAAENVIMKVMIKSRSNGADVNNQKVRVLAREFNDTYAEFDVTLGFANATAAIFTSDDLNNDETAVTIEGYTSIVNTEGFQELDVDGTGSSGQEFYSKWDKGSQSLNDMYERTKWIQKRGELADSNAESGDDYVVDNATITSTGQEFSARDNDQILTEMRFQLKIGAGTPTGDMTATLLDSDESSPAAPTGSVLATSEVVDSNRLTSSYQEVIFRFNDGYTLTADQEYFAVINHPDGIAGDYINVEGDATSADDGNYAHDTAGWTGVSSESLAFEVKSCPIIHGMVGELFRGISVEVGFSSGAGTYQEDEVIAWGTDITYDSLNGGFTSGMFVAFYNGSTWVNGGKVLYDNGTTQMKVALEDISGSTLSDGYTIKDVDDPTTNFATIDTTITNQDMSGGEGILLAIDDNTGSGELYMQVTYGANPVNTIPMYGMTSTADYDATATINTKTVSPAFIGVSTGTNLIGAYGIGPDPLDVGSSDTFFDLGGTQRTPPNNVIFTVGGLVSGEDRILVAPRTGSVMNKSLYTLNGNHTSGTQSTITVNEAIQTETPSEGTTSNSRIRVQLANGIHKHQTYTSWTGSVFTIPSSDYNTVNANDGDDVFPGYMDVLCDGDNESFTAVHVATRDILIRVRDGGATPIKTVESSAQFTGSAQTVTINRVSDA